MPTDRWNDLRAFRELLNAIIVIHDDSLTLSVVLELWDYESEENARKWDLLRVAPKVQARIDVLAEKANEGELTPEERDEYRSFVEAADLLAIYRLKARSYSS